MRGDLNRDGSAVLRGVLVGGTPGPGAGARVFDRELAIDDRRDGGCKWQIKVSRLDCIPGNG